MKLRVRYFAALRERVGCSEEMVDDQHVLRDGGEWRARIRGLRANASRRSHAELDQSTELDTGDPEELGGQYRALQTMLPRLSVVGGCCGTDHRHVDAMVRAMGASAERIRVAT